MKYDNLFTYNNVILNTGQFAYGIRNLIEIALEYSDLPDIERYTKMPDGARMNTEELTYSELANVTDFSKEEIQISFTHKTNGRYFLRFSESDGTISLYVSGKDVLLLNQIDEVLKLIFIPNFSKTTFDNSMNEMGYIKDKDKNQGLEIPSLKEESLANLSNAKIDNSTINISNTKVEDSTIKSSTITNEKSSSKASWSWIYIAAAAITIIVGAIAIWQFYFEP